MELHIVFHYIISCGTSIDGLKTDPLTPVTFKPYLRQFPVSNNFSHIGLLPALNFLIHIASPTSVYPSSVASPTSVYPSTVALPHLSIYCCLTSPTSVFPSTVASPHLLLTHQSTLLSLLLNKGVYSLNS